MKRRQPLRGEEQTLSHWRYAERDAIVLGVQDIDELIEMFKAADDRNYTLFTYVNELNQEVAKLEEQVRTFYLPQLSPVLLGTASLALF